MLAEVRYNQALETAERAFGKDSAHAGVVLMHLWQFYDEQQRDDESRAVRERILKILNRFSAE